jgi:hypothetical protein
VKNEEVLRRVKEERNILNTLKRKKAISVGHILYRNCLLNTLLKERGRDRSDGKTR